MSADRLQNILNSYPQELIDDAVIQRTLDKELTRLFGEAFASAFLAQPVADTPVIIDGTSAAN